MEFFCFYNLNSSNKSIWICLIDAIDLKLFMGM